MASISPAICHFFKQINLRRRTMYKKLLSMLLVIVMTISLAACAQPGSVDEQPGGNDPATSQNNGDNTETQAPEETKKPVEYTTYTEVYSSELGTLNYLSTTTTAVSVLAGLCVDSLVEHDQYGIMRPLSLIHILNRTRSAAALPAPPRHGCGRRTKPHCITESLRGMATIAI